MDEETKRCQNLVKALIIRCIKDTVIPIGSHDSYLDCKKAFDFLFNQKTREFKGFCLWCELADFDQKYWQKMALMNLAYELNLNPWLRNRIMDLLHGTQNWRDLKNYYDCCQNQDLQKTIEEFKNDNND